MFYAIAQISPLGVYKPYGLNTSGVFLQPVVGSAPEPTPDPQTFPPESLALRGQVDFRVHIHILSHCCVIVPFSSSFCLHADVKFSFLRRPHAGKSMLQVFNRYSSDTIKCLYL